MIVSSETLANIVTAITDLDKALSDLKEQNQNLSVSVDSDGLICIDNGRTRVGVSTLPLTVFRSLRFVSED